MTRRIPISLTILLMLAIAALATSSAQAEQRAWECAPEAGEYSDAHCVTSAGLGTFRTVEIPSEVKTGAVATNEKTASETKAAAPRCWRVQFRASPPKSSAPALAVRASSRTRRRP